MNNVTKYILMGSRNLFLDVALFFFSGMVFSQKTNTIQISNTKSSVLLMKFQK